MFIHGRTNKVYYSVREKINYYKNVINKKINVSAEIRRKAPLRLKTLNKINNQTYDEPTLIVTDDKRFGNPISKPRLCVAYKTDSKNRVIVRPLNKRTTESIILNNNINRQIDKKYRAIDKSDIYENKYVLNENGSLVKLDKKDIKKIKSMY